MPHNSVFYFLIENRALSHRMQWEHEVPQPGVCRVHLMLFYWGATGKTPLWSRCHGYVLDDVTRYSSAPPSAQGKINGLCMMLKPRKAFSHQKILTHLSQLCSPPGPHNQRCVLTSRLELLRPCVWLWRTLKTPSPVWIFTSLLPQIY